MVGYVGPYFFKLWYKLHGNIPFQNIHLTCECGHGQMCHAKQRLATDHCSLRGLWFTCMDDAPPGYKPATKSTILILQIFSPVLCDNPSSYQVSDSFFVWMQIKFCQCRTSKGPLNVWMIKRWKRAMSKTSPHWRPLSLFCFRCRSIVNLGMLYENERKMWI